LLSISYSFFKSVPLPCSISIFGKNTNKVLLFVFFPAKLFGKMKPCQTDRHIHADSFSFFSVIEAAWRAEIRNTVTLPETFNHQISFPP